MPRFVEFTDVQSRRVAVNAEFITLVTPDHNDYNRTCIQTTNGNCIVVTESVERVEEILKGAH